MKTNNVIIILLVLILSTSCSAYRINNQSVVGIFKYKNMKGLSTKLEINNNNSFLYEVRVSGRIYQYCSGLWSIEDNRLQLRCLSDSTVFELLSIGYMGQYQQVAKFKNINSVKVENVKLKRVSN